MGKTSSRIVIVPALASAPQAQPAPASSVLLALASLLRVAVLALLACSVARSAWRARGDPWDLAFVAGATAVLAALFLCIGLAERLAPDSPHVERRRLQAAVWALSTVLSCAFAYRISLVMPAALAVVVWGMTSLVVLAGFYMLVLCKNDQRYQLDEVDADAAGDGKPLHKIRPTDELV